MKQMGCPASGCDRLLNVPGPDETIYCDCGQVVEGLRAYLKSHPYKGPLNKGIRNTPTQWGAYQIYFEDVAYVVDTEPAGLGYHLYRAMDDKRVVGIRIFKEALPQ